MSFLTFQNYASLLALIIVPITIYFYRQALKAKKAAAMKFSTLGLIKESQEPKRLIWRKHIQFILIVLSITTLIIGFADPYIPLKQTKEGVNVVLVIDDSGSMKANDYQPNRLEAAKASAQTLIESLNPKDNVGIVLFESGASTSSFLTPFKDKAIEKLKGIAPRDGATALGDGLALAVDMASSIPNQKKIAILLSDGVSNAGAITPDEAITFAKSSKVQVYTIGMGSEKPVILGYDWFGNPQTADLDEKTLKTIADATNGKYFRSVDTTTLATIYKTISDDIIREKEPTSIRDWFFAACLVLLFALLYVNYGRYKIIT